MTPEERFDRLDRMVAEGRVIRGAWTEGNDRACLLAALSPEAGEQKSAQACPASLMPPWLAELTVWLDDSGTTEAWPGHVRRYAAVARRWHVLDSDAWRRLDYTVRALAVRVARDYCPESETRALVAIDGVLALLDREASGEQLAGDPWDAACAAACAAASAASAAAWYAASAAASAARDAAWYAARDAASAARDAASAARDARDARDAEDRMIDAILTALETACIQAESNDGRGT